MNNTKIECENVINAVVCGPAYRCGRESGSLTHTGWGTTSGGVLI